MASNDQRARQPNQTETRVLIVDDEPNVAELTAEFLGRDEEIETRVETSPFEALNVLSTESIDCIVSDYQMPDMNGLEFYESVQDTQPKLPFILFTGRGSEEIASEAISQGVSDYVQKRPGTDQYDLLTNRIETAVSSYRTKQRLREQHGNLRDLMEALPAMVCVDIDGECVYVNQSGVDLLEATRPDELTGTSLAEMIHPDDHRERVVPEDGERRRLERRLITRGGDIKPVEITKTGISWQGEEATLSLVRETTDRKQREQALETLHDATRDLIGAESTKEIAEIASQTATTVLDFPVNGIFLYDDNMEALVHAASSPRNQEIIRDSPTFHPGEGLAWEVFETGKEQIHSDVRRASGAYNPETPIRSEAILPLGGHGVLLISSTEVDAFHDGDVALARVLAANVEAALDRAVHEAALQRRTAELERQSKRLEEFAGVVSHDLRNPLTVASGKLELASTECESDYLTAAVEALDRMDRIIERTLRLARSGQTVGELQRVDIGELAADCWPGVSTDEAHIEIEDPPSLLADPERLQHVFENLYTNAIEHGGSSVRIRVGRLSDGFYLEDSGPGIPVEDRKSVFDTGYSTSEDGAGLGLAIVRRIIEAHGWEITITDGAMSGARFEITGVDSIDKHLCE